MKFFSSVAIALGGWLFALCSPAEPQHPIKIARIGYLSAVPLLTDANRLDALRHGLGELGYIEGKNMVIEWRAAGRTAAKAHADAVLVLRGPVFNSHRKQMIDIAAKRRLPATYPQVEFVEAGG